MSRALDEANRQQRAAADPRASVFVTANAGSGKTKVLVDRIARLLLAGARPSSFLCITYTKAAAAEMQRRLFERLGAWCVASDADLSAALIDLAGDRSRAPRPADLAQARALFASALETPGGLKIQTIHAFCERLLARFPIEAGVAPGFEIADEERAEALFQRARAACALSADACVSAAFERFAARMGAEALEALLDRIARARLAPEQDPAARMRARHGAGADADIFARSVLQRAPWARLAEAHAALAASSAKDAAIGARIAAALSQREGGAREAVSALCRIAFNDKGEPYKLTLTKKLEADKPWIATLLADLCDLAAAAREGLNAIDRAEDAAALSILAACIDAAYASAKAHAGLLDFDDLIAHAQTLLSRADAAPWVLYKLDGGLDHILIDEGQDTSPAQWDLVAPLQEEFFAGAGAAVRERTVFAVGDPKQSIYAFQGADPARFLSEAQTLSRRAHAAERAFIAPTLETSFRSAPQVLRAVDLVFAARELVTGAVEAHNIVRHLASREGEAGMVEVWPLALRPDRAAGKAWDAPVDVEPETSAHALLARALAREAAGWIAGGQGVWEKGALRPMRPGDILVLVRKRGGLFRELIKAFKREGLPVAGADRMVLSQELAVEDCLALVRVALDPTDDYALACVLKGPWLGLLDDDADLFPLAHGREGSLRDALQANAEDKYAPARAFVEALIARRHASAFDLLSWALETPHETGLGRASGWELIFRRLGSEARDPIEELLARALKPPAHKPASLQGFLADLDNDEGQIKREMEAAGDQLRVMTVHGAKGLEAPVVILPDTTAPASEKADEGVLVDASGPYLLGARASDDAATARARAAHAQRALGEHWRLLYVAMTRARDRLIVCGAQHGAARSGEAEDSWRAAVEQALSQEGAPCESPFGQGVRLGAPSLAAIAPTRSPEPVLAPAWARAPLDAAQALPFAAPSRVKTGDPPVFSPRRAARHRFVRGRLIHGLLQRLPEIAPEARAHAARLWLKRQGVEDGAAEPLAREALGVIADPRFAPLFSPSSRAETPIVGAVAGRPVRGVVDRLSVDEENVLILDFKTDRPAPLSPADAPSAYVLQMALYREVIGTIFPQRRVRCALLWTEAPHLTELEEARMDAEIVRFAAG